MRRTTLTLAVTAALAAASGTPAFGGPTQDLAACGAITDPTERLACYDRLSGRSPAAPTPAAPAAPPPAAAAPAAPAVVAPAPVPAPAPSPALAAPASTTAPAPSSAPAPAPAQPAAAIAPSFPSPPPRVQGAEAASAFGSYSAEHPIQPVVADSLSARVTAMGKTVDGRPTVTLEGGALWLFQDDGDPLLAVGDTITIKRGALGSFLLETSGKRLHHVRRLH